MGSNIGIFDPGFIIEGNFYADHYGLDTISLGTTMAYIMECYERGFLTKDLTDGLELNFGNAEAAMELIHRIAEGKGFGKLAGMGNPSAQKIFS